MKKKKQDNLLLNCANEKKKQEKIPPLPSNLRNVGHLREIINLRKLTGKCVQLMMTDICCSSRTKMLLIVYYAGNA